MLICKPKIGISPMPHHPDPDDQNAEQILRMAELRRQITDLAGEPVAEARAPDMPLDMQERFLKHILAFHEQPERPLRDILSERTGQTFPSWKELDSEEAIHSELWRLIRALAEIRRFLAETDHLSDAQCYRLLDNTILEEETTDVPPEMAFNNRISLCDYGDPEEPDGNRLYLKYYADDDWRAEWLAQFPDEALPEPAEPAYDRDRFLPVPPEDCST